MYLRRAFIRHESGLNSVLNGFRSIDQGLIEPSIHIQYAICGVVQYPVKEETATLARYTFIGACASYLGLMLIKNFGGSVAHCHKADMVWVWVKIKLYFVLKPASMLGYMTNRMLDLVLPPQSLLTGEFTVAGIEGELWAKLEFLDAPCCAQCGFPFEFDVGEDVLCARCIAYPPPYSQLRSAFKYDITSRRLVLDFKHGGRMTGLSMFARQMSRVGRDMLPRADFLVPVPLHYRRRIKRRFNQSALLARRLSKISVPQFDPDILLRHKPTESQGGLSAAGRRRNVQGAFRVRDKAKARIRGAHIILIDDVLTTGATLEACAKALKRAGAARVDAITLARVVRGVPLPT